MAKRIEFSFLLLFAGPLLIFPFPDDLYFLAIFIFFISVQIPISNIRIKILLEKVQLYRVTQVYFNLTQKEAEMLDVNFFKLKLDK